MIHEGEGPPLPPDFQPSPLPPPFSPESDKSYSGQPASAPDASKQVPDNTHEQAAQQAAEAALRAQQALAEQQQQQQIEQERVETENARRNIRVFLEAMFPQMQEPQRSKNAKLLQQKKQHIKDAIFYWAENPNNLNKENQNIILSNNPVLKKILDKFIGQMKTNFDWFHIQDTSHFHSTLRTHTDTLEFNHEMTVTIAQIIEQIIASLTLEEELVVLNVGRKDVDRKNEVYELHYSNNISFLAIKLDELFTNGLDKRILTEIIKSDSFLLDQFVIDFYETYKASMQEEDSAAYEQLHQIIHRKKSNIDGKKPNIKNFLQEVNLSSWKGQTVEKCIVNLVALIFESSELKVDGIKSKAVISLEKVRHCPYPYRRRERKSGETHTQRLTQVVKHFRRRKLTSKLGEAWHENVLSKTRKKPETYQRYQYKEVDVTHTGNTLDTRPVLELLPISNRRAAERDGMQNWQRIFAWRGKSVVELMARKLSGQSLVTEPTDFSEFSRFERAIMANEVFLPIEEQLKLIDDDTKVILGIARELNNKQNIQNRRQNRLNTLTEQEIIDLKAILLRRIKTLINHLQQFQEILGLNSDFVNQIDSRQRDAINLLPLFEQLQHLINQTSIQNVNADGTQSVKRLAANNPLDLSKLNTANIMGIVAQISKKNNAIQEIVIVEHTRLLSELNRTEYLQAVGFGATNPMGDLDLEYTKLINAAITGRIDRDDNPHFADQGDLVAQSAFEAIEQILAEPSFDIFQFTTGEKPTAAITARMVMNSVIEMFKNEKFTNQEMWNYINNPFIYLLYNAVTTDAQLRDLDDADHAYFFDEIQPYTDPQARAGDTYNLFVQFNSGNVDKSLEEVFAFIFETPKLARDFVQQINETIISSQRQVEQLQSELLELDSNAPDESIFKEYRILSSQNNLEKMQYIAQQSIEKQQELNWYIQNGLEFHPVSVYQQRRLDIANLIMSVEDNMKMLSTIITLSSSTNVVPKLVAEKINTLDRTIEELLRLLVLHEPSFNLNLLRYFGDTRIRQLMLNALSPDYSNTKDSSRLIYALRNAILVALNERISNDLAAGVEPTPS